MYTDPDKKNIYVCQNVEFTHTTFAHGSACQNNQGLELSTTGYCVGQNA